MFSLTRAKPTLHLVLPGLLNLPLAELDLGAVQRDTPALQQLLRFAERGANRFFDIDELIIQVLGLQQAALPYARALKGEDAERCVLFKAVHLKADINNAIFFPVDENDTDISILINDLEDYFKQDFKVYALPGKLWLMQFRLLDPLPGMPHYLSVVGKKVNQYMQQSRANLGWLKLLNEIQMFLHQHPVNQQRELRGQPLINSLWCWGADSYRGEKRSDLAWFSDDAEMQSLGRLYCGESRSLDELSGHELKSDAVVVDLRLMRALKGDAGQSLAEQLIAIEADYLNACIGQGDWRIKLYSAGADNLTYRPSMRFRFWKKGSWAPLHTACESGLE